MRARTRAVAVAGAVVVAVVVALDVALLVGPGRARAAGAADETAAIRAELQREVTAWNAGDLDGYLAGYERAATTTMIGATRIYRGWDAIAAMYHTRYGDKQRMGTLAFGELEVRTLAPDYAVAVGRWSLQRAAEVGGPAGGLFTLTLHKGGTGWRIVLDHTN